MSDNLAGGKVDDCDLRPHRPIEMHGEPISVVLTQTADQVCVAVEDHGIGIPSTALAHVFQRFYRADNVEEQHLSGMGIGLYVVNEIVTLHGGTVTVDSTEGAGSTFTVILPRDRQTEAQSEASLPSAGAEDPAVQPARRSL